MPGEQDLKPRIFLCHAHEDKPKVRELYQKLTEAGYHPWLGEEDLLPVIGAGLVYLTRQLED